MASLHTLSLPPRVHQSVTQQTHTCVSLDPRDQRVAHSCNPMIPGISVTSGVHEGRKGKKVHRGRIRDQRNKQTDTLPDHSSGPGVLSDLKDSKGQEEEIVRKKNASPILSLSMRGREEGKRVREENEEIFCTSGILCSSHLLPVLSGRVIVCLSHSPPNRGERERERERHKEAQTKNIPIFKLTDRISDLEGEKGQPVVPRHGTDWRDS